MAYDLKEEYQRINGLFVAQLTEDELELFEQAILDGDAVRWYEKTSGFLGLAKVKIFRECL